MKVNNKGRTLPSLLLDYILGTMSAMQQVNSHFYHKTGGEDSLFFHLQETFSMPAL